jgi:hypothetical protein
MKKMIAMFKSFKRQGQIRRVSRERWLAEYRRNHIYRTFDVDFETFLKEPWDYLGKPSPEIQALWDRPRSLLPEQREVARRYEGSSVKL